MDELNYMKQIVREYFDLRDTDPDFSLKYEQWQAIVDRKIHVEKELKELSGYED